MMSYHVIKLYLTFLQHTFCLYQADYEAPCQMYDTSIKQVLRRPNTSKAKAIADAAKPTVAAAKAAAAEAADPVKMIKRRDYVRCAKKSTDALSLKFAAWKTASDQLTENEQEEKAKQERQKTLKEKKILRSREQQKKIDSGCRLIIKPHRTIIKGIYKEAAPAAIKDEVSPTHICVHSHIHCTHLSLQP